MKINVEFDLTPQEFRQAMGLPDVEAFQQELMERFRRQMEAGVEGYDPMSLLPPSKKKAAMDPEMKKLYFGDDRAEQAPGTSEPKIKFREPQDKGAQPGSHPSNR